MDMERMQAALKNAHAAGDTTAARKIANAIKAARSQSTAAGAFDAFTQGATLGFGDEITALESAVLGRTPGGEWFNYEQPFGERYDRALGAERGQQARFREQNPVTATAAEVGGGLATGLGLANRGVTLARGGVAGAAAEGAAYGAATGFGSASGGLEDRAEAAALGGGLGAVTGAALDRIVNAFSTREAAREAARRAPTPDELKSEVNYYYDLADKQGVGWTPDDLKPWLMDVVKRVDDIGLDAQNTPGAMATLRKLDRDSNNVMGFKQLDQVRRNAYQNTRGPQATRADKAVSAAIVDEIDRLIDAKSPELGKIATRARKANQTLRQFEAMEEVRERALDRVASTYGGGNFENAIRQEVRRFLESPRSRGITRDLRADLKKFVRQDTIQDSLREVGRMSPLNGGLMRMMYFGVGAMDPMLAGGLAVTSGLAKKMADAGIEGQLEALVAKSAGGAAPTVEPFARTAGVPAAMAPLFGEDGL